MEANGVGIDSNYMTYISFGLQAVRVRLGSQWSSKERILNEVKIIEQVPSYLDALGRIDLLNS
jgi:hypothetical protein